MTGRKLRLGGKLGRIESVLLLGLAAVAQLAAPGLVPADDLRAVQLVAYASVAAGLLVMPRRLPDALRRRLQGWGAFRRYLREMATLEIAPATAVVVWERYLVYAVALGVADEVEDQVRELLPDRTVRSLAGGGLLRFLGLGWLRLHANPALAANVARAMQPLAADMARLAGGFLSGRR